MKNELKAFFQTHLFLMWKYQIYSTTL